MRNSKVIGFKSKLLLFTITLVYLLAVAVGNTFSWITAVDMRLNSFITGEITAPTDGLTSLPSGFWEIMRHIVDGQAYALIITERPILSGPSTNLYVPWTDRQHPINDWFNGIGYEICPQVVKDAAVGATDVTTITAANIDATGLSRPDPDATPFAFAISSYENRIQWIHSIGKPYASVYQNYWSRSMYTSTLARYIPYTGIDTFGSPTQTNVGVRPALWVKVNYEPVPDPSMIVNPTLEYRCQNLNYTGIPTPSLVPSVTGEMSGDLVHLAATAIGNYLEFTISGITPAGTYSLIASVRENREMGTVLASVNGTNIGPSVSLYGYTQSFENVNFGSFTLSNDITDLKIRFTVTELSTYYGDRGHIILHSLILSTPKTIFYPDT